MSEDEQELLDKYLKMTPGNKLNLLSNARVALAVQENTRLELAKEAKKPIVTESKSA